MWGAVVRAATDIVGGYFVALIVERMLGVMLSLIENAPGAENSQLPGAIATVEQNFLLLVLLGVVIAFLARAHVESQLVGAA